MPAGKGSGNYGSIEVFWDDLRIANIGEIDRKTVHATVLIDKTYTVNHEYWLIF